MKKGGGEEGRVRKGPAGRGPRRCPLFAYHLCSQGIHDFFLEDEQLKNIIVVGPQKAAATLEGSKEFAKEFMKAHNIPTAKYDSFTSETVEEGCNFLETMKPPYVLKADGLAAGKGVLILEDIDEAKDELRQMLVGQKFGAASQKVVIEEFLDGIELSCFVLNPV